MYVGKARNYCRLLNCLKYGGSYFFGSRELFKNPVISHAISRRHAISLSSRWRRKDQRRAQTKKKVAAF